MANPEHVFRDMIGAFDTGDLNAMRALLADDMVAYVTNADAGVDRVEGPDAYMSRIPDVSGAEYSVTVTQVVEVDESHALGMVDIKAEREGRTLHNHAAFLVRVDDAGVHEIWMVDALPAYSDEFWS